MRAQTVNFERGEDPKKSLRIGRNRPIGDQQLVDTVFSNVWDELKDDPKFAKEMEDDIRFHDDVYSWVLDMTQDPETGEIPVQDPNSPDFSTDRYRDFHEEIYGSEEKETDWDEIVPDEWDDES